MLDVAGILFSSLMMLFVVLQAVRLDTTRPWFEGPPKQPAAEPPPAQGGKVIVPWRERRR
ncbi:MAG: hypothetical protein P4L71_00905 [Acetobacteraceae bacterium]|nr:hypothetical protein [Acetobacteraceae bacterium]